MLPLRVVLPLNESPHIPKSLGMTGFWQIFVPLSVERRAFSRKAPKSRRDRGPRQLQRLSWAALMSSGTSLDIVSLMKVTSQAIEIWKHQELIDASIVQKCFRILPCCLRELDFA
jgi:hypothetical protein